MLGTTQYWTPLTFFRIPYFNVPQKDMDDDIWVNCTFKSTY